MAYKYIKSETKNRIGWITLARPEKRNALNADIVNELIGAFKKLESDGNAKVLVLSGEGAAFSAGADLAYLQDLQANTYEENLKDSSTLKDLFLTIYTLGKPVIAKVHGPAIAGGCGLATICDFVYASEEAVFGYTEVKIGFVPALVLTFLIRKIGESKARELVLEGKVIDATEAHGIGLINKVVGAGQLDSAVLGLADSLINNNSGQSMETTKKMLSKVGAMDIEAALSYAAEMNAKARSTEDCKRGIRAFLDKEKLLW